MTITDGCGANSSHWWSDDGVHTDIVARPESGVGVARSRSVPGPRQIPQVSQHLFEVGSNRPMVLTHASVEQNHHQSFVDVWPCPWDLSHASCGASVDSEHPTL